MRRVSSGHVWAVVASIVCGIAVASLLSGSGLPLLLVGVVVLLGIGATALRRPRHHAPVAAPKKPKPPRKAKTRRQPRASPAEPKGEVAAPPSRPVIRGLHGLPAEENRRAGARSESLGRPPAGDDRLP